MGFFIDWALINNNHLSNRISVVVEKWKDRISEAAFWFLAIADLCATACQYESCDETLFGEGKVIGKFLSDFEVGRNIVVEGWHKEEEEEDEEFHKLKYKCVFWIMK